MKHILVFGAGKSSTYLIDYLIHELQANNWRLTVLDANEQQARSKVGNKPDAYSAAVDVNNSDDRKKWVAVADIVISLLPPDLHFLLALDCLEFKKHLLTASYVDDKIRNMQEQIAGAGLIFLCEMGLDPGIDHMSAMKIVDSLRRGGAEIISFKSHCGGLVAPESDDNPWHYKISWNPRNIVFAGKAGAIYREDGIEKHLSYQELFNPDNIVAFPGLGNLSWYANRDSRGYTAIYSLQKATTFLRTTLRHPDFISGWKKLVAAGLTDDSAEINTNGLSLKDFFSRVTIGDDPLFASQIKWLGAEDGDTLINRGICSAADVLQFALEKNLALEPRDKDMIVMMHEIGYEQEGVKRMAKSCLVVKGEDNIRTAMAKTVGLPLAIAAKLILQDKIKIIGLHIPVIPEIYQPVLAELEQHKILFSEAIDWQGPLQSSTPQG